MFVYSVVPTNRGPHMAWYGTTNAGKGTGAHMLWSRLHLIQGIRIFGIDQDEQHEHVGRFLEYLGGRKLAPRDYPGRGGHSPAP